MWENLLLFTFFFRSLELFGELGRELHYLYEIIHNTEYSLPDSVLLQKKLLWLFWLHIYLYLEREVILAAVPPLFLDEFHFE